MNHPLEENLLDTYEYLLLGPMLSVYKGRTKTKLDGFMKYSNLIIDKFATHSSSFFHLSKGIIETKQSTKERPQRGYDMFTVNSVFRIMMENYATFNHLFVEPQSDEEKKFRFLLWKIDGLTDKQKMDIGHDDFEGAGAILKKDEQILEETIKELESCEFYKNLDPKELEKIYKADKRRYSWRFLIDRGKIRPLKITDLVKHTCKTRGFMNMYRYASIHTHTNYLAVEHFEQTRSKPISKDYSEPITRIAIYLTALMIYDICKIDQNARAEFDQLHSGIREYINGISESIKKQSP
ncbi:hypothetical protein [Pedobacter sp. GR22-6]|uniref:hypothetical protein n=1 Tax=Pedobacter sp. GR22-6 TaxID=3127957 RepID=UPI00307D0B6A